LTLNAGIAGSSFTSIKTDLRVNYFGLIEMVQAFGPAMDQKAGGRDCQLKVHPGDRALTGYHSVKQLDLNCFASHA